MRHANLYTRKWCADAKEYLKANMVWGLGRFMGGAS